MKKEMLEYRDFYGCDLIAGDEIPIAKSKADLEEIIEKHRRYLENMLSDAHQDLDELKKRVGL